MYERFHPRFTCIYIYIYLHELIPVKELIASRAPPVGEVLKNELTISCVLYISRNLIKKKKYITRKAGIVRGGSDFPPLIIRFVIRFEYGNQFSSI